MSASRASVPPAARPPERCTASDLRLQWSSAHQQRHRDPGALERLRRRIDATLAALADEIAVATEAPARAALSAEQADVHRVAEAMRRLAPAG